VDRQQDLVAYCLKITNIDPLMYNLLFERFLNPDRVSLPILISILMMKAKQCNGLCD
jgi:hypothetical protein